MATLRAVARRGDMQTSWDAAHSLSSDALTRSKRAAYRIISTYGPLTDKEMITQARAEGIAYSDQRLRTARHDLVKDGLVQNANCDYTGDGRRQARWIATPEQDELAAA